jgi:hypothetical protein
LTDSVTSASGNLCNVTDQVVKTCGNGTTLAQAPDAIYQVQIGATSSAVFTLTGTGFNPYIALMSGSSCNSLDNCPSGYENAGGSGDTISLPSTSGLPAGTYFVVVTDAAAAVDCSANPTPSVPYTLSYTGELPVQLKSFSID